jgi:hypothetical protein
MNESLARRSDKYLSAHPCQCANCVQWRAEYAVYTQQLDGTKDSAARKQINDIWLHDVSPTLKCLGYTR